MIRKRIAVRKEDTGIVPVKKDAQLCVLMTAGDYMSYMSLASDPHATRELLRRMMNVLANEISPRLPSFRCQRGCGLPEDVAAAEAMEQALAEAAAGTLGQG
jgi:hypothetical protein